MSICTWLNRIFIDQPQEAETTVVKKRNVVGIIVPKNAELNSASNAIALRLKAENDTMIIYPGDNVRGIYFDTVLNACGRMNADEYAWLQLELKPRLSHAGRIVGIY